MRHRRKLLKCGIDLLDYVDDDDSDYAHLTLDESDPRWPAVSRLFPPEEVLDNITNTFDEFELANASFLRFKSQSFTGFPQPEDDFGYLKLTYDLSQYCDECGMGALQNAPFRLIGEPKWGRRATFQTHWVPDAIFIRPDIYQAVFEPFAIGSWPVLTKSGKLLEGVLQLKLETLVSVSPARDLPQQRCKKCKRERFLPFRRGFAPQPEPTDTHAFLSQQWFGVAHASDRLMYVSQALYQKMKEYKLNCEFSPCQK